MSEHMPRCTGWCEDCFRDPKVQSVVATSGLEVGRAEAKLAEYITENTRLRVALDGLAGDAGRLLNCGLAISDLLAHSPGFASARGPWSGCAWVQFAATGSCIHTNLANSIEAVRRSLSDACKLLTPTRNPSTGGGASDVKAVTGPSGGGER